MNVMICPVCHAALVTENRCVKCKNGHSFDIAREGYVNLLAGSHKPGSTTGDSRQMALARHAFLEKGYFSALHEAISASVRRFGGSTALDICCGEGYYTNALSGNGRSVYAFDLSREMVRLAAKRREAHYFVANISAIPVADRSIETAIHLFAPFHDAEFSRILHRDGTLLTVIPGKRHLMGMKQILYAKPYENDEAPPKAPSFVLADTVHVHRTITLNSNEDIMALLHMTPYGVRSPRDGIARLRCLSTLETELEFVILALKKKRELP